MKSPTSVSILLLTVISTLGLYDVVSEGPKEVANWFETLNRTKPPKKMTKLHLYFHHLFKGKNVTAVGPVLADDPLSVGTGFMSKRVGYLEGLYMTTSFEEVDLIIAMTFVFTDEIYNGSSLSVLGHNPHQNLYRKVLVVGGSGRFHLARGVAMLQTYYLNRTGRNATIEVDIMVFHY